MDTTANSKLVTTVALKIAEEAAPDEIDLAPIMVQAFIQGGQEKEELFKREQGSLTGGFGPGGLIAIFPWILKTLAKNGPLIYKILTTDVADLAGLLNDLLDLPDKLNRQQKMDALPADPYQPLKTVIDTVSKELTEAGLSQDESDLITFRVVRALLDTPQESTVFIKAIEQGKS